MEASKSLVLVPESRKELVPMDLGQSITKAQAIGTERREKSKNAAQKLIPLGVGTIMLLLITIWVFSAPSATQETKQTTAAASTPAVQPAPIAQPSTASNCDGQMRTYELSREPSLINGGAYCALAEWGRDAEVTVSSTQREQTFPAGVGGDLALTATKWRCARSDRCLVRARFTRS